MNAYWASMALLYNGILRTLFITRTIWGKINDDSYLLKSNLQDTYFILQENESAWYCLIYSLKTRLTNCLHFIYTNNNLITNLQWKSLVAFGPCSIESLWLMKIGTNLFCEVHSGVTWLTSSVLLTLTVNEWQACFVLKTDCNLGGNTEIFVPIKR